MNFKQLKYVIVLSREGSFSKAADVLNISQPSLSQYIKKIEKEIGMELFDRAGGNVRLTDAGRVYIDAGRKILDLEHQMQNKFADLSTYKSGSIIIGISPHRSVHLMPQIVKDFHEMYPGIKLILDERSGHELIDASARGEFDLTITTLPVDEKTFNYESIMKEELILAVPAKSRLDNLLKKDAEIHPNRKYKTIDINLINGNDFIALGDYMPMKILSDKICKQFDISLNYTVEVRSNEALISVVTSGIGSAIIPSCLANFNENGGKISYYSFKQDIPFRDIVVIYRKDQYLSKPIQDLKELLKTMS